MYLEQLFLWPFQEEITSGGMDIGCELGGLFKRTTAAFRGVDSRIRYTRRFSVAEHLWSSICKVVRSRGLGCALHRLENVEETSLAAWNCSSNWL